MAPLRYGAGVKGKVLLSMGYGVPVVGTSIAAEGIPARTRREMMIADDAVSFADALGEVYRDELLWNTLAQEGKDVVTNYFSRDVARTALTGLFRELELS
jgi:glycosyltransferase involved in cell wall biosynthesis